MRILGIETSCDETAAAVVEDGVRILSNVVASSAELHQKTGGIIPEVAAREQVRCIIPVIEEALKDTKILGYYDTKKKKKKSPNILVSQYPSIDAIAVTIGPGLIGSLLVGVETAKTLAYVWQKPIVPVNHLQAHLYANWLERKHTKHKVPDFPAIGLVVSGGHTELVLMKGHGKFQWLGGTRDDAAGECFDKTARLLGLGYPGGPAIAASAAKFEIRNSHSEGISRSEQFEIKLPRPMIHTKDFDFSFSGLKTAVINLTKKLKNQETEKRKAEIAAAVQQAIVDVLAEKTLRAAEKYQVKSILLAGGVAANKQLREQMREAIGDKRYEIRIPPPKLCTDNATYIAGYAYFNYQPVSWQKIQASPGLRIC